MPGDGVTEFGCGSRYRADVSPETSLDTFSEKLRHSITTADFGCRTRFLPSPRGASPSPSGEDTFHHTFLYRQAKIHECVVNTNLLNQRLAAHIDHQLVQPCCEHLL